MLAKVLLIGLSRGYLSLNLGWLPVVVPVEFSSKQQQLLGASLFMAGYWSAGDKPNCLSTCKASALVPSINILLAQQLSARGVGPSGTSGNVWEYFCLAKLGGVTSGI